MLVIHKDSHVDHVPTEILEAVYEMFLGRDNPDGKVIVETITLPESCPSVACGLYGPAMGDDSVTDEEAFFGNRPPRTWPSRLVERPERTTRLLTIVAGPHDGNQLVLFTCYGGPQAPREVADPAMSGESVEAIQQTVEFWRDHALTGTRHQMKTSYASFDEYVKDHPEGERFRNWLGHKNVSLFLTDDPNASPLPGGYFWARLTTDGAGGPPKIWINDSDDTAIERVCDDQAEAEAALRDLHGLAPFSMRDLVECYRFRWA